MAIRVAIESSLGPPAHARAPRASGSWCALRNAAPGRDATLLAHLGPLRALFETTALPWSECAALVAVALLPVAVLELAKLARSEPDAPAASRR